MSEPGDWKCNNCQEINFKRRDNCRKCFVSKYQKIDLKKSDWVCECLESNFGSRSACRKCGKAKSGNPSTITYEMGDWYCSDNNCKEMNFKSRTSCRKCNKPKTQLPPNDNDNCIVCMSDAKSQVIIKCGHLCYCDVCGFNINKCPICRITYNPDTDLLKIYKP